MTSEHTIRPGRDDDVWRDEDGTTWVRQQQLIDAVKFNLNRLRAAADQLEAVRAWAGEHHHHFQEISELYAVLNGESDD